MNDKNIYKKILDSIVETKKVIIIVLDKDLKIKYINDISKKIFNGNIKIDGASIEVFFDADSLEVYKKVITSGKTIKDNIKKIKNNKMLNNTFISTMVPIVDKDNISGIIEILEDYSDNKQLSKKIISIQEELYLSSEIKKVREKKIKNGTMYTLDSIVTSNKRMLMLVDKARKIANSDSPIIIYGDTGTGKELFAQGIHNETEGSGNKPFIAQNCAAIPESLLESILFGTTEGSFTDAKDKPGLFELAEGGTLYLDEINSMNINLQAKLLRVLQENSFRRVGGKVQKHMNVRVIASFNQEPLEVIKKGKFRQDLYYRLNVIYFRIPSLEERKDDIELLINSFINLYNKKFSKNVIGVEEEVLKVFKNYEWQGNVRELKNYIERIMNFTESDKIQIQNISDLIIKQSINQSKKNQIVEVNDFSEKEKNLIDNKIEPLKDVIIKTEMKMICKALNKSNGNVALAARILELPRQTLKNKINKYNIKPKF